MASTLNAFAETKIFIASCLWRWLLFPPKFRPKSFMLQVYIAVSLTTYFEGKLDSNCVCFPVRWLCCNTVLIYHTRDFKALVCWLSLAFFLVFVKIALLQTFCFPEGEKYRTGVTSNLCVPAQRIEMALRLQCIFRLRKWNQFHPGRKGEKMEKKNNCYWNVFFLSLWH